MPALPNLSDTNRRETFATLCSLLPMPSDATDEDRAARAELAMESLAALRPGNAFEADLAAHIVGAIRHANDALRSAAQPGKDPDDVMRCRAQAISMARQALNSLRILQRLQSDRALRTPVANEPPAPVPLPPPDPARLTEVERYAITHPDRAARIRAASELPKPLDFDPPRHSLVRAIVTSRSPILRALDQCTEAAA